MSETSSKSRPKVNGGSRSSRLSSLSSTPLHEQYKNRYRQNGNGSSNGNGRYTDHKSDKSNGSSSSFLGPRLHKLVTDLERQLELQSERSGWSGSLSRVLLEKGLWLEEHIEEEIDLRTNAIGGLDNMWILLSSVSNFNPVCSATYTFKHNVELAKMEETVLQQVDTFPKYKQILANTGRRWHGSTFIDDPNWSVKRHVFQESLPEPAGRKELDDYTAQFVARDWDFSKPLWETIIFNNFKDEESGAEGAMVTRGHHTLTDGQGFVMSQLFVSSYGPELEAMMQDGHTTLRAARRGTAKPSKLHKSLKPLDTFHNTLPLQLVMFALFWTVSFLSSTLEILGMGYQAAMFAYYFLTTSWRQRYATSEYNGPRVPQKEFSTSRAFPMSDVKKLQKAFSGPVPGGWIERAIGKPNASWWSHLTLNDVLCTIIADVIADELEHQPYEPLPGIFPQIKHFANSIFPNPIAMMIPISIRPVANWEMRNWSTGSIAWIPTSSNTKHGLPIGAKAMHKRLHDNAKVLKLLKNSIIPRLAFWSIQITGQAPLLFPSLMWTPLKSIVQWVTEFALESICCVVTNVPGPQGDGITMAGSEVVRWGASPPQAGKNTLGIGIISYAEGVCITIAADHVRGRYSEGVAHRLTDKFEQRWKQYIQIADEVLERSEKSKQRRR
ncbi:hypothetical protein CBS101457_006406 [Exobasidium rhododendri]|nr:hypothetical protein CBS101457_006406 [Exobasidium rhododendri]